MKYQYLITALICCTSVFGVAQQKNSGIISYTQEINIKNSGGGQVAINGGGGFTMPDKITNKFELIFNPNGAKLQRSTVDEQLGGGTQGVTMRMSTSGRTTFFNFAENKVTEIAELEGEEYLLESNLGNSAANAVKSDETKEIIGFTCKKATFKDQAGNETTFWYTTELPVKASPMPGIWIDGVVLGIENQRINYYATAIDYLKVGDKEFTLPKKAKPITQEEYRKKIEEFRSKMQQRGGTTFRFGG